MYINVKMSLKYNVEWRSKLQKENMVYYLLTFKNSTQCHILFMNMHICKSKKKTCLGNINPKFRIVVPSGTQRGTRIGSVIQRASVVSIIYFFVYLSVCVTKGIYYIFSIFLFAWNISFKKMLQWWDVQCQAILCYSQSCETYPASGSKTKKWGAENNFSRPLHEGLKD